MWKSYTREIEKLGYRLKFSNFLLYSLAMIGIIIFASLLLKVQIEYIIFLCIIGLLCLPSIIRSKYKYRYEEKKFIDVYSYMEQMCSSFQKTEKILESLKDTSKILDGKLLEFVKEAIDYLEKGKSKNDIYRESLEIIESEYSCKRLSSLHKLFMKVEREGGDFEHSLNILLQDINAWINRTIAIQKDKKVLKLNYFVALILSIIACSLATILSIISKSQEEILFSCLDITNVFTYQVVSVIFLSACLISFTILRNKLSSSWLDNQKSEKLILEDYITTLTYDTKIKMIRRIPLFLLMVIGSIFLWLNQYYLPSIGFFVLGGFLILFPIIKYQGAKSRTIDEIMMSFPEWLRNMSLNLQYYPVHPAIEQSIVDSPVIFKIPLQKLVEDIRENLSGIEPYHDFLKEFHLNEVKSAMRILYSLSELSHDKSFEMVNVLIERNYKLIDQAEKKYARNKNISIKQFLYMPMFFSLLKIIADVLLLANTFFAGFNDFSNFIT